MTKTESESGGLSMGHHEELNTAKFWHIQPEEERNERLAQLRNTYTNDSVALQQIDQYDPSSEYHNMILLYLDALHDGDVKKQADLKKWFDKHYPDAKAFEMP